MQWFNDVCLLFMSSSLKPKLYLSDNKTTLLDFAFMPFHQERSFFFHQMVNQSITYLYNCNVNLGCYRHARDHEMLYTKWGFPWLSRDWAQLALPCFCHSWINSARCFGLYCGFNGFVYKFTNTLLGENFDLGEYWTRRQNSHWNSRETLSD